jgi:hypothetical protein
VIGGEEKRRETVVTHWRRRGNRDNDWRGIGCEKKSTGDDDEKRREGEREAKKKERRLAQSERERRKKNAIKCVGLETIQKKWDGERR